MDAENSKKSDWGQCLAKERSSWRRKEGNGQHNVGLGEVPERPVLHAWPCRNRGFSVDPHAKEDPPSKQQSVQVYDEAGPFAYKRLSDWRAPVTHQQC